MGGLEAWFHETRSESPNDPKLSDGGGWRAGCMVGGKAAAEAASVTAGAVRCSAWLGVANSTSKCNTAQTSWRRAFPIRCKTQDPVIMGFASNLKCPRLNKSLRFQCFRCCTSKLNSSVAVIWSSGRAASHRVEWSSLRGAWSCER